MQAVTADDPGEMHEGLGVYGLDKKLKALETQGLSN